MRKLSMVVVLVLAATTVGLVFVGSSGAIQHEETLVFINGPLNETAIDIDGDGDLTPGDGWVANSALLKSGEVVGKMVQSCQFIQVRADGMGGVLQCLSSAKLPGGQITAQQRLVLIEGRTTGATAAITGGTGEYANARGVVVGEAIEGSMKMKITLHLIP